MDDNEIKMRSDYQNVILIKEKELYNRKIKVVQLVSLLPWCLLLQERHRRNEAQIPYSASPLISQPPWKAKKELSSLISFLLTSFSFLLIPMFKISRRSVSQRKYWLPLKPMVIRSLLHNLNEFHRLSIAISVSWNGVFNFLFIIFFVICTV